MTIAVRFLASLALPAVLVIGLLQPAGAADTAQVVPPPQVDLPASAPLQTAVLAGGCFWGIQGVFQRVKGVERVLSGYAGGTAATANYETVSSGRTGHAE